MQKEKKKEEEEEVVTEKDCCKNCYADSSPFLDVHLYCRRWVYHHKLFVWRVCGIFQKDYLVSLRESKKHIDSLFATRCIEKN